MNNIKIELTYQEVQDILRSMLAVSQLKNALGLEVKKDHNDIVEKLLAQVSQHLREHQE